MAQVTGVHSAELAPSIFQPGHVKSVPSRSTARKKAGRSISAHHLWSTRIGTKSHRPNPDIGACTASHPRPRNPPRIPSWNPAAASSSTSPSLVPRRVRDKISSARTPSRRWRHPATVEHREDYRKPCRLAQKISTSSGKSTRWSHQIMLRDLAPGPLPGGRTGKNRAAVACADSAATTSDSMHHIRPAGPRLAWSKSYCGFWKNRL